MPFKSFSPELLTQGQPQCGVHFPFYSYIYEQECVLLLKLRTHTSRDMKHLLCQEICAATGLWHLPENNLRHFYVKTNVLVLWNKIYTLYKFLGIKVRLYRNLNLTAGHLWLHYLGPFGSRT